MMSIRFLLVILSCALFASSCKVSRFIVYNFADINDHKKFPSRPLNPGEDTFYFTEATGAWSPEPVVVDEVAVPFDQYLEQNHTVAFLIIRNDSILYERYFDGYEQASVVPSFSMAKSVTSILIGSALDEGLIQSTEEPITRYIPELKGEGFDAITIKHLLQMTSGVKFNESYYNPFGDAATFYYGTNLRRAIRGMKIEAEPGKRFKYSSGDTQLLGLVLERALKNKTITQYLEETLWQPLGMQYPASWSIDRKKDGLEKTFCCINAPAIDYAKIGRLYLHKGNWNGEQIISQDWVEESTKIDSTDGSAWIYQHQWWLPSRNGDFLADGHLGQYIYVNPNSNMVIVRLGRKPGDVSWRRVFRKLAE